MLRAVRRSLLIMMCLAFAAGIASAATLSGTVVDPSGGLVAGVPVTATSLDLNHVWRATSDARGRFQFLSLSEGRYRLELAAPGFVPVRVDLTLAVGQALDMPVRLAAAASEAVEVVGAAPLVEATRTQASDRIAPAEIDALPLNGRNYLDLALLVPGVTRTNTRSNDRFADVSAVPGAGISVGGQRNTANTFIVDGLGANDDGADLAGAYYGEEVVREFEVITSAGPAEFGRASAGVVRVVTQSGTNTPRGRAYGFFRDDAFDARSPLASRKEPLEQRQYGLTLSGPLRRDRTFLFGNVEQSRQNRTSFVTIPAADAAAINQTLDRLGSAGPRVVPGPYATGYQSTNAFGRLDQQTDRGLLTFRYGFYDVSSPNGRNAGGLNDVSRGQSLTSQDHNVAAIWQRALSDRAFNEMRAQYARSRLDVPPNDPIGPSVVISGVASWGTASISATGRDLDVIELNDSLTVYRGAHLFKVGGTAIANRLTMVFPGQYRGLYTFASLPAFLAGRYVNFQQAFGGPSQFLSNMNAGMFVQDEWRPLPSLTVNAGVRYDLQWLPAGVRLDANNLAPRAGLSWASPDRRTVVRLSGGLYFDRIALRAVSNALQRDGVEHRIAVVSFGEAQAPVFPNTLPVFPAGLLTSITTVDPGSEEPFAVQHGVQIERALGARASVTAGYMHLGGRGILMLRNINAPTLTAAQAAALGVANLGRPGLNVANHSRYQTIGRSAFDGLTASMQWRGSPWSTLRASYTLSSARDDAGNVFFNLPQDSGNPHGDWGPSDNDRRHQLVVGGTVSRRLPAGLELGYVVSYATGVPFNVQTGTDRNNDTTVNDRPVGVSRNSARQPGTSSVDLRISRRFRLGSRHQVEAIAEAFNLLNHVNVLNVNNVIGTGTTPLPTFGRPTVAGDPRQIQLGVRWTF